MHVALLSFPKADVWVVGAFGGLGVNVGRGFDEAAKVDSPIAELVVFAFF